MQNLLNIPAGRLHNVSVFLSASVPTPERDHECGGSNRDGLNDSPFVRIRDAAIRIEEAVVCLARAVFSEGGTLVFGGHPSISPLVARVLGHYYLPNPAEERIRDHDINREELFWENPSLVIYQSRAWEAHLADANSRLAQHPQVKVKWVEVVDNEHASPHVKDRPQAPLSMRLMRERMIQESNPAAMVAIGGMQGVLDEVNLFSEQYFGRPIFSLSTTGGAASVLIRKTQNRNIISDIDVKAKESIRAFWDAQKESSPDKMDSYIDPSSYIPYAFVAQQIVAQILKGRQG